MIVCDTGPLVAALNAKDANHQRCLDLLEQHPGPLLVPAPVITEVCWLLESRSGPAAEATFLDALHTGELTIGDLERDDLRRMADLVRRYADHRHMVETPDGPVTVRPDGYRWSQPQ